MRPTVPVLLLAAFLASGCGGADENGGPAAPVTTAAAAPPTTTAPAAPAPLPTVADDRRFLREAVMTVDDMPTGWAETDSPASDSASRCAPLVRLREDARARRTHPRFKRQTSVLDQFTFAGGVSMFTSDEEADAVVERFKTPSFLRCFTRNIEETAKKDTSVTISDVQPGRLALGDIGDNRSGTRVTFGVSAGAVSVESSGDVAVVRRGRAVLFYATTASQGQPPAVVGKRALKKFEDAVAGATP